MKAIECTQLSKIFGREQALEKVTFSIEENTITGLIGRNGAGKTTLMKLIAGFYKPTSGEIKVFSENPFHNLTVSQNVIFIDDQLMLPASLNLEEILREVSRFYPNWDRGLAERLFHYFSLNPKQYHQKLSKGTKSIFNAIIGIAARTPLTLFDEPTTGMDAAVRKDFYRALLKDYLEHPRTIILSSHHLQEIEDIVEDILLLSKGDIRLHLGVDELKEFAIGVSGSSSLVEEWIQEKAVYYKKMVGANSLYVVVENEFSEGEMDEGKSMGLQCSAVALEDICMYLTAKSKGGIDDVFGERNHE